MGFVAAGAIAAVGAVAGAEVSSSAAKKAAGQEVAGETAAEQIQYQEFQQQQANEAPYLAVGNTALQRLSSGLAPGGEFTSTFTQKDLQNSPGYNYQLSQGNQAITAAAAARGMSLSPATLQALGANQQGLASTNFQTQFNDFYTARNSEVSGLQNLAGLGASAVSQSNQTDQNYANQTSSEITGAANAQAAGTIAAGNATGSGISSASNDLFTAYAAQQNQQYLKGLYGTGSTTPTSAGGGYGTGTGSALNDPNYFSAASAAAQAPVYQPTPY